MQRNIVYLATTITLALALIVVVVYKNAAGKTGAIVIPAGNTYLGRPKEIQGRLYPYTLTVPSTVTVTTFPNDPYDLIGLVWKNIDPASNILAGVDTRKTGTLEDFVRTWWKQFGSLKGVASVTPFTNGAGLKGYKATYINDTGASPNLDIFFEVPDHANYVIHLANGVLSSSDFDSIVDSVRWPARNASRSDAGGKQK